MLGTCETRRHKKRRLQSEALEETMSMIRVVRVELVYLVKGKNEEAFKEGVQALKYAFEPRQGRLESAAGCGTNGSYEATCASHDPRVIVEGQ